MKNLYRITREGSRPAVLTVEYEESERVCTLYWNVREPGDKVTIENLGPATSDTHAKGE